MRALFLSHSSATENLGGAERSLLQVIDAWRERTPELDVMVVCRTPRGLLQPELDSRGISWLTMTFESWVLPQLITRAEDVYRTARHNFRAARSLERLIVEFRADIVVTNTIIAPWAALAAGLAGVPHVWFAREYGDLDHGLVFELGRENTFEDIDTLSELVVCNSEALSGHLSQWIAPTKLAVAYPRFELDPTPPPPQTPAQTPAPTPGSAEGRPVAPAPGRQWFPTGNGALRVVCVGRVAESKGQRALVEAVGLLRREGIRIELVLVGNAVPSERSALERAIRRARVEDRVTMTGEVADPTAIVRQADVGAVVSTSEAFGRVTVECLALGKPVVATRSGATPELVEHERVGLLVELGDVGALAAALRRYATDRALLAEHGSHAAERARELALRHPLTPVLDRMEQIARAASPTLRRLPHLWLSWLTVPRTVARMHEENGMATDPRGSTEWRVGRAVTAPPRILVRLARRGIRLARRGIRRPR